jgi:hypothetical protein
MRRTLGILVLVLAGLVGLALAQQFLTQPATPRAALGENRVFPTLTAERISAIRLEDPNGGATFTIARAPGGAWTTADGQPLVEGVGDDLALTIMLLPYERALPLARDANMAEYGFEPEGLLRVQAILQDGTTHGVAVGGFTPSRNGYYALVDEREEIYLLERGAVDFLMVTLRTPPVA